MARAPKRPNPKTPRGSGQARRWFHRGGTYKAGHNAEKRKSRRTSILRRLKERAER